MTARKFQRGTGFMTVMYTKCSQNLLLRLLLTFLNLKFVASLVSHEALVVYRQQLNHILPARLR